MADTVRGTDILGDVEQLVQGHRCDEVIGAAAGLDAEEDRALSLVDRLQVEFVTPQHLSNRGVVEPLQTSGTRGHDRRHLLGGTGVCLEGTIVGEDGILGKRLVVERVLAVGVDDVLREPIEAVALPRPLEDEVELVDALGAVGLGHRQVVDDTGKGAVRGIAVGLEPEDEHAANAGVEVLLHIDEELLVAACVLALGVRDEHIDQGVDGRDVTAVDERVVRGRGQNVLLVAQVDYLHVVAVLLQKRRRCAE